MQKRESRWRYPEKYEHEDLAEYCYKIDVQVTSNSKLTSVTTAEDIAMVLSALMNSYGGVLIIHPVTNAYDISLDTCQKDIVRLITQQEPWIPGNVFNDAISFNKNEEEKQIYFFTNKTTHVVTHKSNVYYFKQGHPESVVDKDVLMDILRTCRCVNDTICENHKGLAKKDQLLPMQSHTNTLIAKQPFPVLEPDSETYLCRNYQLNDRHLTDVLKTQSVQYDILELVSALANTKGGSIFLGVTDAATPIVEGYRLTEKEQESIKQHISDILAGSSSPGPATIWGNPLRESAKCWKTFLHEVVGADKKVIEIRVNKCPGGMFCALPVCLNIIGTGEIYQVDSFDEWKRLVLHGSPDSLHEEEHDNTDCYHKHFEKKEITDKDTSRGLNMSDTGASHTSPKPQEQTVNSQFCWWLSDDGVVAESLQFDLCCSKELADSEMHISTTFSTFPLTEAIMERFANIEYLEKILKEILQEHIGGNGVGVFLENVSGTILKTYAALKDITPACHVFDLVILKEDL